VHGMVLVNGRKVDRPSYLVRPGDVVTFSTKEKPRQFLAQVLEKTKPFQQPPSWIERNEDSFSLKVLQLPSREEFPFQIREQLIVEGASK
jgi:small subunit ribosomal protein S4